MNTLQGLLESSSHAIFVLDRSGVITHINKKAKEQFGLYSNCQASHPAGHLEQGDLVILADTSLGQDDGSMQPADLAVLGIRDGKIQPRDALLAVGSYRTRGKKTVYKYLRGEDAGSLFSMETEWEGIPIRVAMGGRERTARVEVGKERYAIPYFMSIAQMVVVDGKTHQVKFWEERGYTARRESVRELLYGAPFVAKFPDFEISVKGYHFRNFFQGKQFEEDLRAVLDNRAEEFRDVEYEINGFALIASLLPVRGEKGTENVIVKFRSIENIRDTIYERNTAIRSAERQYRETEKLTMATEEDSAFTSLFGNSTAMASVRRRAHKLSQLDCSLLITGESGTGKSFLARTMSQAQKRQGPFLTVDCSTIAPTLFESEMFGYVGGAFTGANPKGKEGYFEAANGGTIFLDEIGEIPLDVQTKLLNVIQNKVVTRVGSTTAIPVDVRIIAATNRDLIQEVATGRFRRDLYYRISAFSIQLPPLRDSQEDLCFIIQNLMDKIRQHYGLPEKCLSGEAFSKLLSYDWPGNIRELENVLESAVVLSDTDIIYAEHIHLESEPSHRTLRDQLKSEEQKIIRRTLQHCNGSRTEAMRELGLSKTVFYGKLKEYGIGQGS
jgi:transcriptional regulator with PAS, ATPase and Fis domain